MKVLVTQSCPALCHPMDCSLPGSSGHGILQARILESESEVAQSCPILCDPMDTRLLHPWDFLGKSTGVGCHFLIQRIFPTQESNPGLLHCRQTLYRLSHQPLWFLVNSMPSQKERKRKKSCLINIPTSTIYCLIG